MASTLQDKLYEIFAEAAGEQTRYPPRGTESFTDGGEAASQSGALVGRSILERVRESLVPGAAANEASTETQATTTKVLTSFLSLLPASGGLADVVKQVEGDGGGSTAGSIATTVLKSAFGLMPLVSGLFNLFGGGDRESPAPLVKYALPAAMEFQAAEIGGREIGSVDYDQTGRPRAYGSESASRSSFGGDGTAGGAQITVNVNAMDARSFLDRSGDIAAAVRDAMLNLNSINDVVNEL